MPLCAAMRAHVLPTAAMGVKTVLQWKQTFCWSLRAQSRVLCPAISLLGQYLVCITLNVKGILLIKIGGALC